MQIAIPNSLRVGFLRSPNASDRIHINEVWGTADLKNGIYVVEPNTLGGRAGVREGSRVHEASTIKTSVSAVLARAWCGRVRRGRQEGPYLL